MAGISEAMSGMAGGGRHGISEHMEHGGPKHEPEGEHDGMHEHMKAMHEKMGGGKSMHVHQHEHGGFTTHHVGHDGKVEGPHDHENMEELKHHMDGFFNEEEHESPHEEHDGLY